MGLSMRTGYETKRRPQEGERGVSKEAGRPRRHRGQKLKRDYRDATKREWGGRNGKINKIKLCLNAMMKPST